MPPHRCRGAKRCGRTQVHHAAAQEPLPCRSRYAVSRPRHGAAAGRPCAVHHAGYGRSRIPCIVLWGYTIKPPHSGSTRYLNSSIAFTKLTMFILPLKRGLFVKIVRPQPRAQRCDEAGKPHPVQNLSTRTARTACRHTLRCLPACARPSPAAAIGEGAQPDCGVSPTSRHARAPLKLSLVHAAAQGIDPSAPRPVRPHCGARRNARQGARIFMTRPLRTPAGRAGR